jgi:hypothetical protein
MTSPAIKAPAKDAGLAALTFVFEVPVGAEDESVPGAKPVVELELPVDPLSEAAGPVVHFAMVHFGESPGVNTVSEQVATGMKEWQKLSPTPPGLEAPSKVMSETVKTGGVEVMAPFSLEKISANANGVAFWMETEVIFPEFWFVIVWVKIDPS